MIRVFFGNPGCGKSTYIVKQCYSYLRKNTYPHVYTNVEIKPDHKRKLYVGYVSSEDLHTLGKWTFPQNSYFALDEAGIEYNNRNYKALPQYTIAWFKLHRHYRVDVDVFSQSWEDMDITIRRLADQLWYMRKIGPWTLLRRVYKRVMIDDKTHQIIDGYRMESGIWILLQPLRLLGLGYVLPQLKGWKLMFRPFYYRYFDSWKTPSTPVGVPGETS